jgi:hypothetical protein
MDKGYDSHGIREHLLAQAMVPVIPPKSNRTTAIDYDTALYKLRKKVERFFNNLQQLRRMATRYEKLSQTFPRQPSPASRGTWWSAAHPQEPVLSGRPWPPGGLPAADRAGPWLASCSGAAGGLSGAARGEKGTPWGVHQREQGGTG